MGNTSTFRQRRPASWPLTSRHNRPLSDAGCSGADATEALLEFTIEPLPGEVSRCRLVQTARFLPRGLLGLAYWYAVLPLHGVVFGRMLRGVRRVAEALAAVDGGADPAPDGRPHSEVMRWL